MDPITHAVIGASIAKISGNDVALTNPASIGIIIGSMFPDMDILFQKWGDYVYLKNHRGISHSVLGLALSALFISLVLSIAYHTSEILSIFIWSFIGCLSHSFFDIFNSYGAKLLWPFHKKKFSLSLLIIFDPIFFGTLIGYISSSGRIQYIFLVAFVLYLLSRVIMRLKIISALKKDFCNLDAKIFLLPSMTGLLRWHFIIETMESNIIGEKNIFKNDVKIIQTLNKLDDEVREKVIYSPVGEFFSEFTPLFHIELEKDEGIKRYVFTDMRYYLRNDFLHHAILELDECNCILKASFNPYSIKRSSVIPIGKNYSENGMINKIEQS